MKEYIELTGSLEEAKTPADLRRVIDESKQAGRNEGRRRDESRDGRRAPRSAERGSRGRA